MLMLSGIKLSTYSEENINLNHIFSCVPVQQLIEYLSNERILIKFNLFLSYLIQIEYCFTTNESDKYLSELCYLDLIELGPNMKFL